MFAEVHFIGKSSALTLHLISWERGMQNFFLPRWERRLQGILRDRLAKHRQRLVWPCAAPYAQPPRITKNQLLLFSQQCSLRSHFRRHLNHLSCRKKKMLSCNCRHQALYSSLALCNFIRNLKGWPQYIKHLSHHEIQFSSYTRCSWKDVSRCDCSFTLQISQSGIQGKPSVNAQHWKILVLFPRQTCSSSMGLKLE